ncbi:ABC transporter permease [Zymomonas mobilis]|uniref:ABC-2 type transporter n=1 Tax=Zymomonas mobilis subsp. mobilis (strain ATCC 10988 / DSM 424 / LMG 404 / NCIMB 8938 / NRRL B-806 / ZM1) TaxID=555217 RepID=A0A0H3G3S1_ZYMMA|nr:ABC transporter permease [Zymomonas mobilis]AEH63469.1 ABC-2 type transporter [Zymomonas mobilis subsp. mobilis ATCC 10988]ART94070.2 ABC transporter [Zymomonas mobilis subsp. mobilis]TQL26917.1 capsular polysaccharide transport system permease protein [Zymomonas mobilis]TQL30563.1 capsular polysaccharide transport system permease protein [Zymomonas mobilis]TWD60817.1 capsular polysaccharide transport system permease protein [Zymomonas mobilis]
MEFDGNKITHFFCGLKVQFRVIGALILRELHTRYGRENIGYLWIILEPMLFATGIGILHAGSKETAFSMTDIRPIPFAIVGYGTFIIFRNIVNRSAGTVEANAPLLYHRMVSLFDMLFARVILEAAGIMCSVIILLFLSYCIGLGTLPVRPIYLLLGQVYMTWLSLATSIIVCAITYENATVERLIHPMTYFCLPISAIFFMLEWIPNPYRTWLEWVPLAECTEMVRYGQFESASGHYFHFGYLSLSCSVLTLIGLLSLRIVRKHISIN